jgi:hypothetical protein
VRAMVPLHAPTLNQQKEVVLKETFVNYAGKSGRRKVLIFNL